MFLVSYSPSFRQCCKYRVSKETPITHQSSDTSVRFELYNTVTDSITFLPSANLPFFNGIAISACPTEGPLESTMVVLLYQLPSNRGIYEPGLNQPPDDLHLGIGLDLDLVGVWGVMIC